MVVCLLKKNQFFYFSNGQVYGVSCSCVNAPLSMVGALISWSRTVTRVQEVAGLKSHTLDTGWTYFNIDVLHKFYCLLERDQE